MRTHQEAAADLPQKKHPHQMGAGPMRPLLLKNAFIFSAGVYTKNKCFCIPFSCSLSFLRLDLPTVS